MEESLSEALSYIKEIVERNVLDQEFIKEKKDEICYLIYKIIVTVNRLKAIVPIPCPEERNSNTDRQVYVYSLLLRLLKN